MAFYSFGTNIIMWPSSQGKETITNAIKSHSRIPSYIGIMDSALIPLIIRPNVQGKDHFTRKMNYVLSTFIVTVHEGKVLYVHGGYVDLTHDN